MLEFYGVKCSEENIMSFSGTVKKYGFGTDNSKLAEVICKYGLDYNIHESMSWDLMERYIDENTPVLVNYLSMQNGMGHFAVVIGYNETGLFLQDPKLGEHYFVSFEKFESNWKSHDKKYTRWGLVFV